MESKVDAMECHGNEDWVRIECDFCFFSFLLTEKLFDEINLKVST